MSSITRRRPRHIDAPEPLSAAVEPEIIAPTISSSSEYIITFAEDAGEEDASAILESATGLLSFTSTAAMGADEIASNSMAEGSDGVFLARLGLAVGKFDPDQIESLQRKQSGAILAIEPAPVFFALAAPSAEYLKGWADCSAALLAKYSAAVDESGPAEMNESSFLQGSTWGLRTTGVTKSGFNGNGIKIAILDTGLNLEHPDFAGRNVVHQSFIPSETVQDQHSHGTHCAGTACGPQKADRGPRYGVAWGADIYIGKVLANSGSSRGRSVELGMEWAIANRCHIISMSLGSPVLPGGGHSVAYERIGSRALRAGTLLVAAAGNDSSRRRGTINPVSSPANCPSIMSVGAVDSGMSVADFSNGAVNGGGGAVDIAGPGVDIHSAVPMSQGRYGTKSGTSMATPHVAGIAALWAQATGKTGRELWDVVISNAKALRVSARDVGAGLVEAP